MNVGDPVEWYTDIPVVSRCYLTLSVLTTAACALDLVSPFSLYFNYNLIVQKGELWRLVTNFLFFGPFSIDFVFHMYFLCRYSRLLEENSFRQRTADFVLMLVFGAILMTAMAPFVSVHFLSASLTFMLVYVWGRRNQHERMSFLGIFPFTAPFLPWVLLCFSLLLGSSVLIDVIGMAVGHVYFFLEDVYPSLADARGWRRRRIMYAPKFIANWFGDAPGPAVFNEPPAPPAVVVDDVAPTAAVQQAAAAAQVGGPANNAGQE